MAYNIDPLLIMEPDIFLAYQQQQAGVPTVFQITLSPLTKTVLFVVGSLSVGRLRQQVSGYNIHFLSMDLASPSTIYSLEGAESAFNISDIVLSLGAPGPGGLATGSSVNLYGKAGYYFCAPVGTNGVESRFFAGPVEAPLPGDIVTANAPPDVSDPNLVVTTETINHRSVRRLDFFATAPSVGKGVVAVTVISPGSVGEYTYPGTVPVTFTGSSGSGAEATAIVAPNGTIQEVRLANTGNGYITTPQATVTGTATLLATVADAQAFGGFQIYIDGYFGNVMTESFRITKASSIPPGGTMSGTFYLLPDTPPTGGPLTFYYVSVSPTGSRRTDPLNAPSFTLAGGLT